MSALALIWFLISVSPCWFTRRPTDAISLWYEFIMEYGTHTDAISLWYEFIMQYVLVQFLFGMSL